MRIAVITETDPLESRVAATPETVKKIAGLGGTVAVQSGAGLRSGITDADYQAAGAEIAATAKAAITGADVILKVRRPAPAELKGVKKGALVIAILDPYGNEAALQALAESGVASFAMEL